MQIKKADRSISINKGEECGKSEASEGKKPGLSKGIAESESKFETLKSSSLFQDSTYYRARSANVPPTPASERTVRNASSLTTSITDGTSNTVVVGEASHQKRPVSGRDGGTQQSNTTTITDGTSNTIVVGENTEPPAQDQQAGTPITARDGDGRNVSNGNGQGQQSNTTTITDGTSNTIVVGENTEPPAQEQQAEESENSSTTITDGTSNTISFGEDESSN